MSGKYTPGPWVTSVNGGSVETEAKSLLARRTYGYGCGPDFICDLNDGEYHEYANPEEQIANARLIAAAPDLLEACKAFMIYHEGDDETDVDMMLNYAEAKRQIVEAIKKAEGRT